MIVHLFPNGKFTLNFIEFINNNFDKNDHFFFIYDVPGDAEESDKFKNYNNVSMLGKINFKFLTILYNSDAIILHSLFLPKQLIIFFNFFSFLLKKTGLVFWGAELQPIKLLSIKDKLVAKLKYRIANKQIASITLASGDYDLVKKKYNVESSNFSVIYGNGRILSLLKSIEPVQSKEKIRILIGNSATKSNHHLEVFSCIEKFLDYNIEIIVPLSYGDEQYRNEVMKAGLKIFGNKFNPILDFLDYKTYLKLLSSVNVAIFNNDRQQGLGNIRALSYFGCKMYIRSQTSMERDLKKDMQIFDITTIQNSSFEDFVFQNEDVIIENREAILSIYESSKSIKQWEDIFFYIKHQKRRSDRRNE